MSENDMSTMVDAGNPMLAQLLRSIVNEMPRAAGLGWPSFDYHKKHATRDGAVTVCAWILSQAVEHEKPHEEQRDD